MKRLGTSSILALVSIGLISFSQAQLTLETEFFFPHIVDGTISQTQDGEDVFQTTIILSNPNDQDANVNLSFSLFTRGEDDQATDDTEGTP